MVTRVKPVKNNPSEGYEEDFDENVDFIDVRGVVVQNDTSVDETVRISRDASNNLIFQDGVVSGTKTLTDLLSGGTGITEPQHEALDTLNHWISETSHDVVSYTGNKITNLTTWTDNTLTTKVREQQITYTGNKVTQTIEIQYNVSGVEIYRVVEAYTYSGNNFASVTRTRI